MIEALEQRAAEAARACARAEFAKWSAVLDLREAMIEQIEQEESAMFRRMAVNASALEVGRLLQLSEQQVWRITTQATRLRDELPTVWSAFAAGDIDVQKASAIAVAVDRLKHPESVAALDAEAVAAFAAGHTVGDLRRWINKVIDRLELVTLDEAEAAFADRHVTAVHGPHGMSEVTAKVLTSAAVAMFKRLRKAAAVLGADDPTDERTQAQKQADLFCAWLTNATGTECDILAEVAVVVDAQALAGVTDAPAQIVDLDDDFPIPARWVFGLADTGSILWTRLLTDPAGHVLDVTHLGYQPPESLRRAVQWRDMTCRVSGCHRRAELCDLDHVAAFDAGGATTAANLQTLCRRHHGMKGHGLLPADAFDPPSVHLTRLPRPPLNIDYIAA